MINRPDTPDDLGPYAHEHLPPEEEGEEELFESERNIQRVLGHVALINGTDIERTGSFEEDNQAVYFTANLGDRPEEFPGFACFVQDAWVDVCLLRDWSPNIRLKFRDHAEEIMNTIGLHGVSLYFTPNEDTHYMCPRVFTEGLNFDVFRACIYSLIEAQSRVARFLDRVQE